MVRFLLVFIFAIFAINAHAKIDRLLEVDDNVWRGSQPKTKEDFQKLKSLGIKTLINLRWDPAVKKAKIDTENAGIEFINVPIVAKQGPTDEQMKQIFSLLLDKSKQPIYLHCTYGKDRTGLVFALYRVNVQHMDPQEAYKEWLSFGFAEEALSNIKNYFWNHIPGGRDQSEALEPLAPQNFCKQVFH